MTNNTNSKEERMPDYPYMSEREKELKFREHQIGEMKRKPTTGSEPLPQELSRTEPSNQPDEVERQLRGILRNFRALCFRVRDNKPNIDGLEEGIDETIAALRTLLIEARIDEVRMWLDAEDQELDADYRPVTPPYPVIGDDGLRMLMEKRLTELQTLKDKALKDVA